MWRLRGRGRGGQKAAESLDFALNGALRSNVLRGHPSEARGRSQGLGGREPGHRS